jgi:hypothetical protein
MNTSEVVTTSEEVTVNWEREGSHTWTGRVVGHPEIRVVGLDRYGADRSHPGQGYWRIGCYYHDDEPEREYQVLHGTERLEDAFDWVDGELLKEADQ